MSSSDIITHDRRLEKCESLILWFAIVMNDIHNILQTKAFCMKTKKFFLLRNLILTNPANNMAVLVVETFGT